MSIDMVIVRDWRGRPLKRLVDSVDNACVFVVSETTESLPIGCPAYDVFSWNQEHFQRLEGEWERTGMISEQSWRRLSPYRPKVSTAD